MFTGKEPVSRKFQSLTAVSNQMVMFGGQSLEDSADLNDLFYLRKVQILDIAKWCQKQSNALTSLYSGIPT